MNKLSWIALGVLVLIDIWLVWSAYRPQPQETTAQPEVVIDTISNTTAQTQADCDTAEDPYDCDYERVMAKLGNPTRDERRGAIIEHDTHNTYRNEFWGFQFDYPKEWKVKEYAYGASYSLFNVGVWSVDAVEDEVWGNFKVSVTLDRWWQRVLALDEVDNISWHQTRNIGGKEWRYPDKLHPSVTLPIDFYIFNSGEYWFTLENTVGFEDVAARQKKYDSILNSFEFFEVGY